MVNLRHPRFSKVEERSKQPPRRSPLQTQTANPKTSPSVQPQKETIIKRSKDS